MRMCKIMEFLGLAIIWTVLLIRENTDIIGLKYQTCQLLSYHHFRDVTHLVVFQEETGNATYTDVWMSELAGRTVKKK